MRVNRYIVGEAFRLPHVQHRTKAEREEQANATEGRYSPTGCMRNFYSLSKLVHCRDKMRLQIAISSDGPFCTALQKPYP